MYTFGSKNCTRMLKSFCMVLNCIPPTAASRERQQACSEIAYTFWFPEHINQKMTRTSPKQGHFVEYFKSHNVFSGSQQKVLQCTHVKREL